MKKPGEVLELSMSLYKKRSILSSIFCFPFVICLKEMSIPDLSINVCIFYKRAKPPIRTP